jgi:hypothetical protein
VRPVKRTLCVGDGLLEAMDGLRAPQLDAGEHRLLHRTTDVVEVIAQFPL